jgi:hypothetical protein
MLRVHNCAKIITYAENWFVYMLLKDVHDGSKRAKLMLPMPWWIQLEQQPIK